MTDVFGMFPHFETNNNSSNGANNFQSANRPTNLPNDKAMLHLNNYPSSIEYDPNLFGYQDETANCYYQNNNQYRMQTEEQSPPHKPEIIHSGHFMVSEIDKDDDADNEANVEEEVKDEKESIKDDQQVEMKVSSNDQSTGQFGDQFNSASNEKQNRRKNWNIEYPKSLDSLFKKMNLGKDSKLISPKWKQFKGMKIGLKNKIRVNNLIWRAWHIKYVMGRNPAFNPFPQQLDTDQIESNHIYVVHRPEVMRLNKYLKNQSSHDFIALEYIKWRRYYKEIIQKQKNQITRMDQSSSYDAFNNQYDSSNDQFNMGMFNSLNNYSSAQLGMQAEYMQPDFSYGLQSEFMDTFEEPCMNFLNQKNFLPLIEEEGPLQDSPKIQDVQTQPIYPTTDNSSNYDQRQMGQNQFNNNDQMVCVQQQQQQQTTADQQKQQQFHSTSTANYNYTNYQQQNLIQNQQQQNQMPQMTYTQQGGYLATSNLIVDQQNTSSNVNNAQQLTLDQQNQLSSNTSNNCQFAMPSKLIKEKIRSRSVSSLPQQQQIALQREHMIENSSSLMEINNVQQMLGSSGQQSTFHNTTSNLSTTQANRVAVDNRLQNQSSLSNQRQNSLLNLEQQIQLQQSNERTTSSYQGRSNVLGVNQGRMISQQQVMQQQQHSSNQLSTQLQSGSAYYSLANEMSTITSNTQQQQQQQQQQQHQQTNNSPLAIDYANRATMHTSTNSTIGPSVSYYSQQQQLPQSNSQSIQANSMNQNLNTMLTSNSSSTGSNSNYNMNHKYQSTSNDLNSNSNLISQLLSTNRSSKLTTANLNSSNMNSSNLNNNAPFKRNSTGTHPSFQSHQQQYDQFGGSLSSSSSINNLVMNTTNTNVNTNLNLNAQLSSLHNELNNYQQQQPHSHHQNFTNRPIRKSSNQLLQQQTPFSFNSSSGMNPQQQQLVAAQTLMNTGNDLATQIAKQSLTSSQENLNKGSISTKSHRIKREHHRKLSTGKMRNNSSSSLSRSNSCKSLNAHSPVSPTTSLKSTLMGQATNKQLNIATNDFLAFDRSSSSNILLNNGTVNLNSNLTSSAALNQATSPLSSTPTLQSPLANSPFTSNQNDYSNDSSLAMYNTPPHSNQAQSSTPFGFMNHNLNLSQNSQLNHKPSSAIKSASQSSSNSSTNSNNIYSSSLVSSLIKNERDPTQYREHRRVCHINAEQKRRCNIKHGFDTLRAILPSISSNNNTKISKAAMLQKGAEHIRQLRIDYEGQNKEIQALQAQIEALNQTIGIFQNQLPATGAPISGMRPGQIKERFESYVREKTQQNWKFWMFSIIMEPLLDSYNNTIPTTNFDELTSSVLRWLDQSCNLTNLRREVLTALRVISTNTNVLTGPSSLSAESLAKVVKKQHYHAKKK